MATIRSNQAIREVQAYQAKQSKRAALVAALVALYFRNKVAVQDPKAVENFLRLMVPKIMTTHEVNAREAAKYANKARRLEVPKGAVPYEFQPITSINEDQIRASLMAVGVKNYSKKAAEIRRLPDREYRNDPDEFDLTQVRKVRTPRGYDAEDKAVMLRDAKKIASDNIAGSVQRLTLDGARETLVRGAEEDPRAIGFIRVTKSDKPCWFCVMLASRGIDSGGVYQDDSFDLSDARFSGPGTAKVHDNCSCAMVPVRSRDSDVLAQSKQYQELWAEFGDNDLLKFRKNLYEAGLTKHR